MPQLSPIFWLFFSIFMVFFMMFVSLFVNGLIVEGEEMIVVENDFSEVEW